jgi:DNA-binding CsgD family transcriptional regulator
MVIGTLDAKWRVRRISVEVYDVLGFSPAECIGISVLSAVHPSDTSTALSYMNMLANAESGHNLNVRIRCRPRGWQSTNVLVCSLVASGPSPFAFALTRSEPEREANPNSEQRIHHLETRLRRIALEIRAAGVTSSPITSRQPRAFATFAELTARQQEILERLMAGQRAPGIARDLYLSQNTVRNHLSAIFRRYKVHSQSQLIELLNAIGVASDTTDERMPGLRPTLTRSMRRDESSSGT